MKFALPTALSLLCSTSFGAGLASPDSARHWVGTWSAAPYLVEAANMPPSPGLTNNTLRQVVRVSIGGDTLRLKLTNVNNSTAVVLKAVNIAISSGNGAIQASTLKSLRFQGNTGATMAAGASVTSDPLAFALAPDAQVAITIAYGATSSNMTGHVGSRTNSYIVSGDKATDATLSGAVTTPHWYSINTLDVRAPNSTRSVAIIGNSITDGYGLTPDLQNRWTDVFSRSLLKDPETHDIGVLNMGIGGTTVLGTSQTAAVVRFQRDVLDQAGLGWVIVYHGVNDIGSSNASAKAITDGLKKLADAAKAKGVKVYGATIIPFNGNAYYSTAHEAVRRDVNAWIRTSGNFDAVIDFDKTMRDPADTTKMKSALKNDWLHPNTEGLRVMGESVDIKLFRAAPTSVGDRTTASRPDPGTRGGLLLLDGGLRVEFGSRRIDGSAIPRP